MDGDVVFKNNLKKLKPEIIDCILLKHVTEYVNKKLLRTEFFHFFCVAINLNN